MGVDPVFGRQQMGKLVDGRAVWYGRPVRGGRASIVAAVFFLAASTTSSLRAAEPPADSGAGVVVFAVDPRARDAQAMVDAVRAHLTGLPVRLVIDTAGNGSHSASAGETGGSGGHRTLGTLTIEAVTPGEWVVSFTEPAVDTTLVRRIRLKPQGKAVALEEAAIVVRSMVEAILDGGHLGIARPAVVDEGTARSRASGRHGRRGLAGSAGYVGTTFAPQLGWQSGVVIGLRWQWSEFYAGASYGLFPSILTQSAPVSIALIRHPGAIVLGYEGTSRLAPIIELDLAVDYVRRDTIQLSEGFARTPPQGRWIFGIGGQAGVAWSVLPRFRLLAKAGVDWMMNPYSYVAFQTVIIAPAAIRPKVGVGLVIDFW
jgi:hypothetical protein